MSHKGTHWLLANIAVVEPLPKCLFSPWADPTFGTSAPKPQFLTIPHLSLTNPSPTTHSFTAE
ncbi:MAG: hypothetical protein J6W75_08625 [Bacteroidaceae bacterium]|nr:hypothetical protein [Bacteroidaceae bacterium]